MAENELKRELEEGDLKHLVNDLSEAEHKAMALAVQLDIKKATRDAIVSSTKDAGDMLRQVLEEFLQGNGSEPITRETIIRALESPSVKLPRIAKELTQKYSTSFTAPKAASSPQESVISNDSGFGSSGLESKTDSSEDAGASETPLKKLQTLSHTEHAVTAPQAALSQAASVTLATDSGFYSSGSKRKSDSSDPETLPKKLLCVSHAATGRPCSAPTDELQEYNKLFKGAILECRKVFTKLRKDVCSTCFIAGVDYLKIKEITVPFADSPSQLEIGLSTAKSWDSVWKYLDAYTGWENSKPIEMLTMEKGSERDSQNLDEFTHKRKWLLKLLEMKYDKRTKELVLELDEDYDEFKGENIEVMRLQLCNLLACHVTVLKVERGCVMITVAIPAETAEDIFPLSPAMREEFRQAFPSIISVKCGKINEKFENTHNSEKKEVTESQDEEGESEKSDDEEGYTADESVSDCSTELKEEHESRERHAGQSEESLEPQMTETTTPDVTEQEADVEQEGGLSLNKNIIEHKDYGEVFLERSPAPLPNHMKERRIITEMSDWDPAMCKICGCRIRAPFKYKGSTISSNFTCDKCAESARYCARIRAQGRAMEEAFSGLPPNAHFHFGGGSGNMLPSSSTKAINYR